MEKTKILPALSFLILSLILTGCSTSTTEGLSECNGSTTCSTPVLGYSTNVVEMSSNISKIEVIHFHGTNQCYSCKTVGAYAEETVNTYFADEVKSGKITFSHINAELPENRELAVKYGVTSASLWIGTYFKDGQFKAEQNTNVWYKISDKDDYLSYLKGVIEQKMEGN
jgi:hypothetical protein